MGAAVGGTVGVAPGAGVVGLNEDGDGVGESVSSPRLPHHNAFTAGQRTRNSNPV